MGAHHDIEGREADADLLRPDLICHCLEHLPARAILDRAASTSGIRHSAGYCCTLLAALYCYVMSCASAEMALLALMAECARQSRSPLGAIEHGFRWSRRTRPLADCCWTSGSCPEGSHWLSGSLPLHHAMKAITTHMHASVQPDHMTPLICSNPRLLDTLCPTPTALL